MGTTCAETLGITPETYRSPDGESKCQAHSIRISGTRDAALDFAGVLEDPHRPTCMLVAYHPGDGLHPVTTGSAVMANNIHLRSFWPKDD